ncbi:MAG: hypothetical protein E7578_01835 [Ruminococcaceae bacterium]|nr:hypothetical protein [Oscillospiraceae bacterium]
MKKIISALLILTMIFSVVCVSTSAAAIHVNMNFESMEVFTSQFIAGAFYVEDNLLYGYAEAKALQTQYDDSQGWFDDTAYTWLTYDASITLAIGDDELSETDRYVNLVYCNDNVVFEGRQEDRLMMSFGYDVQNGCFRFGTGWNIDSDENEHNMLPSVAKEINTDGEDFFTMGISVKQGNIRCFYNDELIFNFVDANNEYLIAHEITSPFLFWQDGNFIQISNITIGDHGALYPEMPDAPIQTQAPVNTNATETTTPRVTTTKISEVVLTDDKGNDVTDDKGNKVTETVIITEPPVADTNTGAVQGGNSSNTGDVTFIVVAAMVATLGCALIVRKVSVK